MATAFQKEFGVIATGIGAIVLCLDFALAQEPSPAQSISKQEWFQLLPAQIRIPAEAAEKLAKDSRYQESIKAFKDVLAIKETQDARGMFRAWVHQWLAYNYSVLDSAEAARKHVRLSLQADIDIWPDDLDKSLHSDVWVLYRECYAEIFNRFQQKHQSLRLAIGTIVRADYSYRFLPHLDLVAGIGVPVLVGGSSEEEGFVEFKEVQQVHFYLRLQRMRKNIERLTGGFFLEYALVHDFTDANDDFINVISAGPLLSYSHKSGWEYGGVFTIAQLGIKAEDKIKFSSYAFKKGDTVLNYSNFEIYVRKWF